MKKICLDRSFNIAVTFYPLTISWKSHWNASGVFQWQKFIWWFPSTICKCCLSIDRKKSMNSWQSRKWKLKSWYTPGSHLWPDLGFLHWLLLHHCSSYCLGIVEVKKTQAAQTTNQRWNIWMFPKEILFFSAQAGPTDRVAFDTVEVNLKRFFDDIFSLASLASPLFIQS